MDWSFWAKWDGTLSAVDETSVGSFSYGPSTAYIMCWFHRPVVAIRARTHEECPDTNPWSQLYARSGSVFFICTATVLLPTSVITHIFDLRWTVTSVRLIETWWAIDCSVVNQFAYVYFLPLLQMTSDRSNLRPRPAFSRAENTSPDNRWSCISGSGYTRLEQSLVSR